MGLRVEIFKGGGFYMKTIKVLIALVFSIFFMVSSSVEAFGENDPVALQDFNNHPSNYIVCGGASIGIVFYVYKNSIDVQNYSPPNYQIALKMLQYSSNGMKGELFRERAYYIDKKYKYDYSERKIYIELKNENGNFYWQLIDPKIIGTLPGYKEGWDKEMVAAEIAFYSIYGISFFDTPLSNLAQKYINNQN